MIPLAPPSGACLCGCVCVCVLRHSSCCCCVLHACSCVCSFVCVKTHPHAPVWWWWVVSCTHCVLFVCVLCRAACLFCSSCWCQPSACPTGCCVVVLSVVVLLSCAVVGVWLAVGVSSIPQQQQQQQHRTRASHTHMHTYAQQQPCACAEHWFTWGRGGGFPRLLQHTPWCCVVVWWPPPSCSIQQVYYQSYFCTSRRLNDEVLTVCVSCGWWGGNNMHKTRVWVGHAADPVCAWAVMPAAAATTRRCCGWLQCSLCCVCVVVWCRPVVSCLLWFAC